MMVGTVKQRNMLVQVILMVVTLGIYTIYWYYQTTRELKLLANDQFAEPGAYTMLLPFFPFGTFYSFYKYGELCERVSCGKFNRWIIFVFWIVFPPMVWFKIQTELNNLSSQSNKSCLSDESKKFSSDKLNNLMNIYRLSNLSLISGIALWFFYSIILVIVVNFKKPFMIFDYLLIIAVVGSCIICMLLHAKESYIPYLAHIKNINQIISHIDRIKKWSPKLILNLEEWQTWEEFETETETIYTYSNDGGGSCYSPDRSSTGSQIISKTNTKKCSGWIHLESIKFPFTKCKNGNLEISSVPLENIRDEEKYKHMVIPIKLDVGIEFGDKYTEIAYDQIYNFLYSLSNGKKRIIRSGCKPKWLWSHIICVNNFYDHISMNRFVHRLIVLLGFGWFYGQWFYKKHFSKAQVNIVKVTKVLYSKVDNSHLDNNILKTKLVRRMLFNKYVNYLFIVLVIIILLSMKSFIFLLLVVGIYYFFIMIVKPLLFRYLPYFKD